MRGVMQVRSTSAQTVGETIAATRPLPARSSKSKTTPAVRAEIAGLLIDKSSLGLALSRAVRVATRHLRRAFRYHYLIAPRQGRRAYSSPDQVRISVKTTAYVWVDQMIGIHHCLICGCVTHWHSLGEGLPKQRLKVGVLSLRLTVIAYWKVRCRLQDSNL